VEINAKIKKKKQEKSYELKNRSEQYSTKKKRSSLIQRFQDFDLRLNFS